MNAPARRATLFGKLPAHGDFVARGMSAAERDELDNWLTGLIADARSTLGKAFEDNYDQAPPWRFAVRSAEGWHAGAMAPSMDGVGRRYPIVVGIDGIAAEEIEAAAEAAEELIYAALGEGWDADRLADAVAARELDRGASPASGDRWWTLGGGSGTGSAFLANAVAGARPAGLMQAILTVSPLGQEEAA